MKNLLQFAAVAAVLGIITIGGSAQAQSTGYAPAAVRCMLDGFPGYTPLLDPEETVDKLIYGLELDGQCIVFSNSGIKQKVTSTIGVGGMMRGEIALDVAPQPAEPGALVTTAGRLAGYWPAGAASFEQSAPGQVRGVIPTTVPGVKVHIYYDPDVNEPIDEAVIVPFLWETAVELELKEPRTCAGVVLPLAAFKAQVSMDHLSAFPLVEDISGDMHFLAGAEKTVALHFDDERVAINMPIVKTQVNAALEDPNTCHINGPYFMTVTYGTESQPIVAMYVVEDAFVPAD